MASVLIRRYGTLMDLSADGASPPPEYAVRALLPELSYEHRQHLHGVDRYNVDGTQQAVDVVLKRMYARLPDGRLQFGFGHTDKVVRILRQCQLEVRYADLSPPRTRPNCYTADWDNVRRMVAFRSRQEDCLRQISQRECGVIVAAPGFGKTYAFEMLAHLYPWAKFDIVVKPKDVAARIVRQLSRSIPDVGMVGGGKKHAGERITVVTADSTHLRDGDVDFLLGDEAHQLLAENLAAKISRVYRNSRNFGFTASPVGRGDGSDATMEMMFGPEIFRLTYPEAVELNLVVPIHVRWLPIRLSENPAAGLTGVPKLRWGIWRNQERNRLIAEDVRGHYGDPGTQVLIFVTTFDHAVHLWQFLPEFTLCYAGKDDNELDRYKRSGLLPEHWQIMTDRRRNDMRDAFASGSLTKVIATDVWSTGVDFSALQVLYRADAIASGIRDVQIPGRVSRISDGKSAAVVVDCYDVFDKTFKGKSLKRRTSYRKEGWSEDWPERRTRRNSSV